MARPGARTALLTAALLSTGTGRAQLAPPATRQFDTEILRERGLGPAVSQYFSKAARFTAGVQWIEIKVNGQSMGQRQVLIDSEGRLCFTPALVQSLGLQPMQASATTGMAPPCPDYRQFAPRAVVELQPGLSAADITVPGEYVQSTPRVSNASGGLGAQLSYRGFANQGRLSDGTGGASGYRYWTTTAGFNAEDWIFRSSQDYSSGDGQGHWYWRSAYAQKVFEAPKHVLQAGHVTVQDPLFGGTPIVGAQWFPERALYAQEANFAITGAAATRARVEIRQGGVLLLTTTVPPGPFSIQDYPLQNRNADLQVRVIEETGAEQLFTVPASSLLLAVRDSQFEGWSIAGGRYWDQTRRGLYRQVPLASASHGWTRGMLGGTAGGLLSGAYTAAAAGLHARFDASRANVFGQVLLARDSDRGWNGVLGNLAAGKTFGDSLQAGVSGSVRSARYRSLQESLASDPLLPWTPYGYRSQIGANLSWNAGALGGFSAGLSRENYFYGDPGQVARLSWDKSWPGGVSLSVGLSLRTTRLTPLDVTNPQAGDQQLAASRYVYATLTVPLGKGVSSRTYVQRLDGADRVMTGIDQRINDSVGYRASVESADGAAGQGRGGSIAVYGVPYYSSLSAGFSRIRHYDNAYFEASGGVVATGDGVAFSPYAVQDSFGTIRTGDVVGARIETPQGPVWSGPGGLAAVPGLVPYQPSRLELGGRSIPLDIEIENGLQTVQSNRGAVLRLKMNMVRVRRFMLVVSLADGSLLPMGTAVLRNGEFLTAAGEGGRMLVTQAKADDVLSAELADGSRCEIRDIAAFAKKPGDLFERARAQCR